MVSTISAWLAAQRREFQPERRKLYPTWQAAQAAAGAYDDGLLSRFRVARSTRHSALGSALDTPLPLVVRALNRADLVVTDFGGSCGELGRDFIARWPGAAYTVVETGAMVRAIAGASEPVRHVTEIPESCDIFYSGGTLQYVDDPLAIMAQAFRTARRAVVLTRNSFCTTQLFRVQKSRMFENGGGPIPSGFKDQDVSYPHRTIRESDIQGMASARGFVCVARLEESSGVYRYQGKVYGRQLVFVKMA